MRYYIYLVTNTLNGKQYVGRCQGDPERRWKRHIRAAFNSNESGHHLPLRKALRDHGVDNFSYELVFQTSDKNKATAREQELIERWNTLVPDGYNLTDNQGPGLKWRRLIS